MDLYSVICRCASSAPVWVICHSLACEERARAGRRAYSVRGTSWAGYLFCYVVSANQLSLSLSTGLSLQYFDLKIPPAKSQQMTYKNFCNILNHSWLTGIEACPFRCVGDHGVSSV